MGVLVSVQVSGCVRRRERGIKFVSVRVYLSECELYVLVDACVFE